MKIPEEWKLAPVESTKEMEEEHVAELTSYYEPGYGAIKIVSGKRSLDIGTKFYTRPDNSALRKAAEELLNGIHERNLYSASMPTRFWDAFENLRVALEEK